MNRLETFLKKMIDKYNSRTPETPDDYYKILGTGNFSIVLDVDGAAYKITTEGSYDRQLKIAQNINALRNMGINVPFTYCVHSINESRNFMDGVRIGAQRKTYKEFINSIERFIKAYKEEYDDKIENFCGIYQEKITGTVPFDKIPKQMINSFAVSKEDVLEYDSNPQNYKNHNYAKVIEDVREEIHSKLDYYLSIPDHHYVKFMQDAFTLNSNQVRIDNVNRQNFIYNKDKGFYFIDLDGLNFDALTASGKSFWPLHCTVENVLSQFNYSSYYFDHQARQKYVQLYAKMFDCLSKTYLSGLKNKEVTNAIKLYTLSKQGSAEEKLFKSFLYKIPMSENKKYTQQYELASGIIKGNLLVDGKENI